MFKKKVKRPLISIFSKLDGVIIPGSEGASLYDIGAIFFKSVKDIRLSERAAAISFSFLMAIPPSLIFLFSLVPFLPLDAAQDIILKNIALLSPSPKVYETATELVVDFMETKRRELISFGFLITIFVSSNGMMGLLRSFDRGAATQIHRTGMARRWKAIRLTLILMLVVLLSIAMLVMQSNMMDRYFRPLIGNSPAIKIISWFTLVFIVYITICIIYKYGPALHKNLRFFSPGALFATLAFFGVSYGFFFVANHFINYNKVYGSIGTLLMFMGWTFIISLVFLIGFEINLAIVEYNHRRQQRREPTLEKQNP